MSEIDGILERGGRTMIVCCLCGKFAKADETMSRVAASVPTDLEPRYEMIHKDGFGCRSKNT